MGALEAAQAAAAQAAAAQEAAEADAQKAISKATKEKETAQKATDKATKETETATKEKETAQKATEAAKKQLEDCKEKMKKPAYFNVHRKEMQANIVEAVRNLPDVTKAEKTSVAFVGARGDGKSSIINKLVGGNWCQTDDRDCTVGIHKVAYNSKCELFDCAGETMQNTIITLEGLYTIKFVQHVVVTYTDDVSTAIFLGNVVAALPCENQM